MRLTRYGGDCYSYCMLAAGHLDLVVETELKPYDIAALIPIITGAGGVVTTWEGKPAQNGGRIIAAGDPRVHEAATEDCSTQPLSCHTAQDRTRDRSRQGLHGNRRKLPPRIAARWLSPRWPRRRIFRPSRSG